MSKLKLEEVASFVLEAAKTAGATDCYVSIDEGTEFSVNVRDGKFEGSEDNDTFRLSLVVYIDKQSASETVRVRSRTALRDVVQRAVSAARLSPPDQFKGLPEAHEMLSARDVVDLELLDPALSKVSRQKVTELALRAEAAAISYDPRAKISNGASYVQSRNRGVYANSRGFSATTQSGYCQIRAGVVATEGDEKQTGGWYSTKRFFEELDTPENIGRLAAKEAVEKLGGRRVKSQSVPLVAERHLAGRLLGYFAQAASGGQLYTKQSFLVDKLDQSVASPSITIIDTPNVLRGLGSRPYSEHGLPAFERDIVRDGVLKNYLLDIYSARRMGTRSNGGGSTNMCIVAGNSTPEEIIASVDHGLYLESVAGHGFNPTNGNISFQATGKWIENGKLSFPVSGITIAGNLLELFQSVEAVGNDLIWEGSKASPTLKFKSIAVAGE